MIQELKTPCYIFNQNDFENNLSMFKSTLNKYFGDNWILGYSFKTNYLPYLLKCVCDNDCYAEVVSEKEYNLAQRIGFSSDKVIYNGPVKTKDSFNDSLLNKCIVNIDSKRELLWLSELPKNKNFKIGIRINFDLEERLPGNTLMGDEGGRFGFSYETGELHNAIDYIKTLTNVKINCLHMHVSSKTKAVQIYKELVKFASKIIDEESLDIDFIDIGGSFFGGGDDGSSYDKYIKEIKDTLSELDKTNIGIIVEPGASVVASSFSYLLEVIDIKTTSRNKFVVTDGSRMHIDPFFVRNKYSYDCLTASDLLCKNQVVSGFTCMEKDRIMKLEMEKVLQPGDRILFNNVGSYTMCMNSDFIEYPPRVYAIYKDNYFLVSKVKKIADCLNQFTLGEKI